MSDNRLELSENDFTWRGFVPQNTARAILRSINNGNAPFLPDASQNLNLQPIYNAKTGYILPANTLIPMQIQKIENGFESNIVATSSILKEAGTQKKQDEKAIYYNFKDKEGKIKTAAYVFPEQTEKPDAVIGFSQGKLKDKKNFQDVAITVNTPEDYMAAYFAANKSGMKFSFAPELVEQVKKNVTEICNNQLLNPSERSPEIPGINEYLFKADQRANELIKSISQARKENLVEKAHSVPAVEKEMERA